MFLCDKCGLQFQIIEELDNHLRDYHYQPSNASVNYDDTGQFFCPQCLKNFKHQRSLTRHLRYKTCLRCRLCKKTFDSKVWLEQHRYTHFKNLQKSMDQESKKEDANEIVFDEPKALSPAPALSRPPLLVKDLLGFVDRLFGRFL